MSSPVDSAAPRRLPRVVHMSSVHSRQDVRVFLKECRGIAADGFDVTLIVADGRGRAQEHGVTIIDAGRSSGGRLGRVLGTASRVYRVARRLGADIYHFHDPELLPWAWLLRVQGRRVIYDAHENVPHDILSKPYLSRRAARLLAAVVGRLELFVAKRLSAVVAATPDIGNRFHGHARICVGVFNFPLAAELSRPTAWADRRLRACYVGLISPIRGARELAAAAVLAKTQVSVAGPLAGDAPTQRFADMPGWSKLEYLGVLGRTQVAELMSASRVGIVTFLPELNHINALPNKLFEYMSAGLAVVASDFPGWRAIVEGEGCGLCVDPRDPRAIAAAIDRLADDDALGSACGARGADAVRQTYNWDTQLRKLLTLYRQLLVA